MAASTQESGAPSQPGLPKALAATFVRPEPVAFKACRSESIDYAVMEHCPSSPFAIHMVALDAGWSDLGAWDAVWAVLPKDAQGNAHVGDVLLTDSHNSLVQATSQALDHLCQGLPSQALPNTIFLFPQCRGQGPTGRVF